MSKPVAAISWYGPVCVYQSHEDIPARDSGCGEVFYAGRCTRPNGHDGEHGQPNWRVHVEVESHGKSVQVEMRNSHQAGGMGFYSFEQWREFIDLVDAEVMDMFRKKEESK